MKGKKAKAAREIFIFLLLIQTGKDNQGNKNYQEYAGGEFQADLAAGFGKIDNKGYGTQEKRSPTNRGRATHTRPPQRQGHRRLDSASGSFN